MKLTCWVCPRTWATWSYSLHPAGLLLWQDRELTRIQKVVRGFLFYRPTAVLNQGCDLLTSLIHASRITSCVSSTVGTDSQMYHKSTGHIPAKLNCSFSSRTEKHLTSDCLFFLLDWNVSGITDGGSRACATAWRNTETVIRLVRCCCSWRNGRCAQGPEANSWLLLFPFQPLPSKLQRHSRAMAVVREEVFRIWVLGEALTAHRSRITLMLLLFS